VQFQLTPAPLNQRGERIRVTGPCPGDKISVDDNPSRRDRAVSGPVTGIDAVTPGNRARRAHFPGCRASTSTDGVV